MLLQLLIFITFYSPISCCLTGIHTINTTVRVFETVVVGGIKSLVEVTDFEEALAIRPTDKGIWKIITDHNSTGSSCQPSPYINGTLLAEVFNCSLNSWNASLLLGLGETIAKHVKKLRFLAFMDCRNTIDIGLMQIPKSQRGEKHQPLFFQNLVDLLDTSQATLDCSIVDLRV